jgi:hypothetical protein
VRGRWRLVSRRRRAVVRGWRSCRRPLIHLQSYREGELGKVVTLNSSLGVQRKLPVLRLSEMGFW